MARPIVRNVFSIGASWAVLRGVRRALRTRMPDDWLWVSHKLVDPHWGELDAEPEELDREVISSILGLELDPLSLQRMQNSTLYKWNEKLHYIWDATMDMDARISIVLLIVLVLGPSFYLLLDKSGNETQRNTVSKKAPSVSVDANEGRTKNEQPMRQRVSQTDTSSLPEISDDEELGDEIKNLMRSSSALNERNGFQAKSVSETTAMTIMKANDAASNAAERSTNDDQRAEPNPKVLSEVKSMLSRSKDSSISVQELPTIADHISNNDSSDTTAEISGSTPNHTQKAPSLPSGSEEQISVLSDVRMNRTVAESHTEFVLEKTSKMSSSEDGPPPLAPRSIDLLDGRSERSSRETLSSGSRQPLHVSPAKAPNSGTQVNEEPAYSQPFSY